MSRKGNTPRILYVSEVAPNQTSFGGGMRSASVFRALQELGTVEALVLEDQNGGGGLVSNQEGEFKTLEITQRPIKGPIDKLRWTLDPTVDYPNGCGVAHGAMQKIVHSLKDFDLIWFFKLRSPDMFPNAVWPRSIVDIDDLPSSYERAIVNAAGSAPERLAALRRLWVWRRREKMLGDRFTVLAVCSDEDRQYLEHLGVRANIHVLPNGFEMPSVEPTRRPAIPPRLGFIGLFDYFPNREAMQWFTKQCWPLVKREVPDARLRLVGEGSDRFPAAGEADVDGLGWLADPAEEIKTWSGMVVPIRVGAGTRVKIAYGFSRKCPIVSTSFGAFGYKVTDGREIYLADSPEAFSSACVSVIRKPKEAAEMAERAWQEFLNRWTWDAIRPAVWAAAANCLGLDAQVRPGGAISGDLPGSAVLPS